MLQKGTRLMFRTVQGKKELVSLSGSSIELTDGQLFALKNIPTRLQRAWNVAATHDIVYKNGQFNFTNGTIVKSEHMPEFLVAEFVGCEQRDYPTSNQLPSQPPC
ncbi:MAG: hypothetical protein JNN11_02925 [Candidatus Doudnabacteria bacterium]|nr:hypothetical protein [Candidatus Doudnabacteria bacterium]